MGMAKKHAAYGTGFAGAKLVCALNPDAASLSSRQKHELLDAVAWVLDRLNGQVYTGCDLNVTLADIDRLAAISPYVLAALPNLQICPNATTAHGVVGAIEAAFNHDLSGKRFLVHGCGSVGSVVAAELRNAGARVMALDQDPSRAAIDGVERVDASSAWWRLECDAIVPCSASYLLDEQMANELRASTLVGATNLLFASAAAHEAVLRREITFVPESVSSAGAVIGDSIEHYDREAFVRAAPSEVYGFVREAVARATSELLAAAAALEVAPSRPDAFALVALQAAERPPVGERFRGWAEGRAAREAAESMRAPLFGGGAAAAGGGGVPKPSALAADAEKARLLGIVGVMRPQSSGGASAAAGGGARSLRGLSTQSSRKGGGRRLSTSATTWGIADGAGASSATADVVIAGAGIMGLNIAYQLKRRAPELSVLVLERAPGLGHGSSGYSTGFQRAYYSFDETMQLALDGMSAYKNWKAYTGLAGAEESFTETGALWLLGKPRAENEAMVARLAQYGIRADALDAHSLAERFPVMSTEPYPVYDEEGNETPQSLGELSAVYEHGCGHVDPNMCLADMLAVARRDGVDVRLNAGVDELLLSADGSKCVGVRTAAGERISAGVVVNATGPWFEKLMNQAGVVMSTTAKPTRIQVAHKHVPDEYLDLPFTADAWGPSGIYFMPRRQNKQLVFGSVDHRFESEILEDPDACNPALDPDVKQDFLNCLLHRLPGLSQSGEVSGFSSM